MKLWNFVQFQVGWFCLVLSAADGSTYWGYLTIGLLVAVHLFLDPQPAEEGLVLLLIGFLGWSWETAVQSTGWLLFAGRIAEDTEFPEKLVQLRFAPLWMAALWVNFATCLNHSLSWLGRSLPLAAVAGMIGGPLAFVAGESLGAVELIRTPEIYLVLALGWLLLTPLVLVLAHRLKGAGPAGGLSGGSLARASAGGGL